MVEDIIQTRINKAVSIHDVLHGFSVGRIIGKSTMELNITQEMVSVDQEPLLLVFLDLRELCGNLDSGWILKTLEGYWEEKKNRGIIEELWACQEVVTWKNGYHGPHFRATSVTIQGGLTSPSLFNILVDNVVRNCLSMKVEDEAVINDGLGHAVGQIMGVFYTYDGIIGLRDPEWIQGGINILIGLFRQIGLVANTAKYKMMTCQPGTIWSGLLEEALGHRSTGIDK